MCIGGWWFTTSVLWASLQSVLIWVPCWLQGTNLLPPVSREGCAPEPGSLAHGASLTKSSLISLDFGLLGLVISFYGHLVFQTGPQYLMCPRPALNSPQVRLTLILLYLPPKCWVYTGVYPQTHPYILFKIFVLYFIYVFVGPCTQGCGGWE